MSTSEGLAFIKHYFPDLSRAQVEALGQYSELLIRTNQSINLISRKSEDEVWVNHILHALSLAKVVQPTAGQRIIDVGTGGGLPGIPMAILFPDSEFLLVDSIQKKINAVQVMVEQLDLNNVRTKAIRVEQVKEQFDFAISRAVTALPKVDLWLHGKIKKGNLANIPNGLLYIKGGDFEDEIKSIGKAYKTWNLNELFDEPFFETKKIVWLDLAH